MSVDAGALGCGLELTVALADVLADANVVTNLPGTNETREGGLDDGQEEAAQLGAKALGLLHLGRVELDDVLEVVQPEEALVDEERLKEGRERGRLEDLEHDSRDLCIALLCHEEVRGDEEGDDLGGGQFGAAAALRDGRAVESSS